MDNTNAVLAPLVSENVKGGLWSLTAHYGRGDEARDAMRKQADALRQPTQSDEWQAGYEAGIEAAAKALKADAKLCDCAALEARGLEIREKSDD